MVHSPRSEQMELDAFSISLAVKDNEASKASYGKFDLPKEIA